MWREAPLRLFLAALVPLIVAIPLRLFAFPDWSPETVLLLGPAFEESLKLTFVVLLLTLASVTVRGGRDPGLALRYWLVFAPWAVGGLYGMVEGLLVYPGQGGLDFTAREVAHGTFVALAWAVALRTWARVGGVSFGIAFGFITGFAVHVGFNILAYVSLYLDVTFADQAAYLAPLFVLAVVALLSEVRQEPASAEVRTFLPARGGLRP